MDDEAKKAIVDEQVYKADNMVDVSRESPEQTETRLCDVLRKAELRVFEDPYTFEEIATCDFPAKVRSDALALIRDEDVWSQLVPCGIKEIGERFALFSFHFAPDLDNSGFVGWLATRLKLSFGTGVFVVCGQNTARGGIYDYWGCPAIVGDVVLAEVRRMMLPLRAPIAADCEN